MTDAALSPRAVRARSMARIAQGLFLSWVAIVALLHILRPDLSPLRVYISNYAIGSFGFLMGAAFIAWSLGLAVLVIAVFLTPPLEPRSWTGLILLSLCSVLMFLVGLFRTDPTDEIVTTAGGIHVLAAFLFFLLQMIAMMVFSIRLRRQGLLGGSYHALFLLAIAAPISFVLMMAYFGDRGMSGLGQRIFAFILISWLVLFAHGMQSAAFGGALSRPEAATPAQESA